jgi:hypothetical protein
VLAQRPRAIAYRHLAFIQWRRGGARGAIDTLQRAVTGSHAAIGVAQLTTSPIRAAPRGGAARRPLARQADADADTLNSLGMRPSGAGRRGAIFERVLALDPEKCAAREPRDAGAGARRLAVRAFSAGARADPQSSRAPRTSGWWR